MVDRETILKKIDAQKKEWEAVIKHLQSKAENFEADSRIKFQQQIDEINKRLKEAEMKSDELKKTTAESWRDVGDNLLHAWNDLVMNIDNAILRLKK